MNQTSCAFLLQLSRGGLTAAGRRGRSYSGSIKVRPYLQYIKRKVLSHPSPPYSHVCQVGDPVLRAHAAPVDPAAIPGPEVQKVIATMVKVMRKLRCVGLSAPQVGVPLRILSLEYPERMVRDSPPPSRELLGLSVQPLRIFVNPHMTVLDSRTALFQEACESISGYSAAVPRFLSVGVSGVFAAQSNDISPKIGFSRSEREGGTRHVARQRLAGPDPPARDGPPGRRPLRGPHGQQDVHQHRLAGTQ